MSLRLEEIETWPRAKPLNTMPPASERGRDPIHEAQRAAVPRPWLQRLTGISWYQHYPAMSKTPKVSFATTIFVRDACLCLNVQRAARALARRFDEALRPIGLTNGQFSLLMSLNRPQPPNIKTIAALLAVDRTTLTAALKPLERRGLVEVKVDTADSRGRLIILTSEGRSVLSRALPLWETTHAAVETLLADARADAGKFRRSLRTLS